jgi:hypothetical protein
MALSLITKVWPIVMQPGRKFVLVALCDAANDDGACFLCVETIAYKCGMGVRTVQGHLIDLEADGFIWREERLGRSSIYSVNVVALEDAEKNPLWLKRQAMKRTPAKTAGVAKTPAETAHPPARTAGAPAETAPIPVSYPSPTLKNKTIARSCVLPDDFTPDQTAIDMANETGVSITAELPAFTDHHTANGSTFKDWQAAFRTWLRNAVKFSKNRQASAMTASNRPALSFTERDRIAGMQQWEAQCNQRHPDLPVEYSLLKTKGAVIDATPASRRISK